MSVTIRDVARQAGVSVATVSRHFTGSGPVGQTSRSRIEEAARRLRYVPNHAARSLITSRTRTLGLLLPDVYGEFFSEVLRGFDRAAHAADHLLLVSSSHHDRAGLARALRAIRGRVDGVVVMAPEFDAAMLREHLPPDLRLVLVNAHVEGVASVGVANGDGARAAMRHLVGLGHRRIGFIGGPSPNQDAADRLAAYRDVVADAGLDADAGLTAEGDFSDASGHAAMRRLLDLAAPPTAVFAANDAMAIGAMGAVREAGRRVPDDVAIVGFDDIPMARFVTPPLTTVRTPLAELARRAIDHLLAPSPPGGVLRLPTDLVVRASCGAA